MSLSVVLQSAVILLREGVEAMLVIAILAAAFHRAGQGRAVRLLGAGAATAILASLAAAVVFALHFNGAHDDRMEAAVMLLAAGLMFYMSGWLFLKQDPAALAASLKAGAHRAMASGASLPVFAIAFFAVFREGAETILFLHALAQTSGGWSGSLLAGLALAALALAALYVAMQRLAMRVPMRPVFLVTSALLFVMGLRFVGAAVQEFQEQALLPFDEVGAKVLTPLGFNPSWEAIAPQLAIVAIAIVGLLVARRRSGAAPAAAE